MHTRVETKHEDAAPLVSIHQELHHDILRFGQPYKTKMAIDSLETPDGQLVSFEVRGTQGSQSLEVSGRVEGGKLTYLKGKGEPIAWEGIGGFLAVDENFENDARIFGEVRAVVDIDEVVIDAGEGYEALVAGLDFVGEFARSMHAEPVLVGGAIEFQGLAEI